MQLKNLEQTPDSGQANLDILSQTPKGFLMERTPDK